MSGVQFSQDRLNGLRTSDALVGDAYWDTGLGKAAIALAVPIRQADGKYVGALMAKINLRAVAEVLQRLAPRVEDGGSGGDVYVVTDQGRLILRSRVSSAELMRAKLPTETAQALVDREGTNVEYKRADGRDVIGTLRRVPALRWAAVAEIPRAEAFRQAGGGGGTGVVLLVALLLVAGLAAYVGVLIVRPLQRLSSVAAKVAAGDHSVELPTGGGGEVGQLTQVFKNLVARVREREGQGELERLSVTDALTGLYNRRHLMGTLANEVQRSRRLRRTFSVLLADVDHFKQYNDTHGHLGGDAALVKVAEILRQTTRGVDTVARYGGEEFVVMLIEAPIATAAAVGERLRARVAAEDSGAGRMTVSVGAAEYPTHGETPEELIASADAAMYQAKGEGRDRVVLAGRTAEREQEGKRRRKGEG
jgi:diguanylate cyclase (GGDEF)-like protein